MLGSAKGMENTVTTCPFCAEEVPPTQTEYDQVALQACRRCINPFLVRLDSALPVPEPLPDRPDIREEVAPGSVMAGILGTLNMALDSLPVLPEIPQRILAMVHDPLVSMNELAEVINKDAVISVKVFKLANSAFYASAHEIRDLNVACARLGLKVIANTVYALANSNLYRTGVAKFRGLMQDLWRHSLTTAYCADELGLRLPGIDTSVLFEAGLVHDIGKLVLLDIITVKYKGNVGRLRDSVELLLKVIQKYHALVGLHVAQHWNLAPGLCFSTFYHNDPDQALAGNPQRLADVICLSSDLAHSMGYGLGEESQIAFTDHSSAARLGLAAEDLEALRDTVQEKVASLIDIFSIV